MRYISIVILLTYLLVSNVAIANINNSISIDLGKQTYILPYYYTQTPDQAVYAGSTPDDQRIKNNEFKAQISLKVPLAHNLFGTHSGLTFAYTQLMYWQPYTESPYFRELNYEPELYLSHSITKHWLAHLGIMHQSNGRGGNLERSWNRAYFDGIYHTDNIYLSIKPWVLLFTNKSSGLHNADITHYLGYSRWLAAYQYHQLVISFMSRNNLESGFSRGAEYLTLSYPIHQHLRLFIQGFSGYGQSLIEYNHYTNGLGIGIALNDWL